MTDLHEIWGRTQASPSFKAGVIRTLQNGFHTPLWNEDEWHQIMFVWSDKDITADLDVQRYDGYFFIYPTFMGEVLMDLDPMLLPISEVEQS